MVTQQKEIITVEHFTAAYQGEVVLDDISFKIYQGEIFVIAGGSGCGKSTILKHLIGLYQPFAGKITVAGQNIVEIAEKQRLELLQKIGVLYQSNALFGSLTVLENVRLALDEYTNIPQNIKALISIMKLDLVGLKSYRNHMPAELSGGMKKRAALARAMVLDPQILFLDEPSAGLDPITSATLDQLIIQISQSLGITFVIVTHELASIYNIADRVIVLDKARKKIIATGPPKELRDSDPDPFVQKFFKREPE